MNRTPRFLSPALVILTMALVSFGLIMVYSAAAFMNFNPETGGNMLQHFARQLQFVGVGMLAMIFLATYDYPKLARWSRPVLLVVIVLLALVHFTPLGVKVNGAQRWLKLGPLPTLQPSEFAKLAIILYLADCWTRKRDELGRFFTGVVPNMLLVGAAIALVLVEPHKSATLILGTLAGGIWFLAGGRLLHLFMVGAVFVALLALVIMNSRYGMQRFEGYLNHEQMTSTASYQPMQAELALNRGGLFGMGLGEGLHKMRYIPEPHTDYIFAVIGEELGFLATAGTALAFALLVLLGVRTAMHAPDRFGFLLASGTTMLIGMQAFFSMGTVTRLLPSTGVPLPFISYGGTSIITALAAMGVLINVAHSAQPVPVAPRKSQRRR